MSKASVWAHSVKTFKVQSPQPPPFCGRRFSEPGSSPYQKQLAWVGEEGILIISGEKFYGKNHWNGNEEILELARWIVDTFGEEP